MASFKEDKELRSIIRHNSNGDKRQRNQDIEDAREKA